MQSIVDAKAIIKKLNENNYEAYLVGGCVRDYLLQSQPNDFDITTNAHSDDVEAMFENTIPTGKDYGTISVKSGDDYYEVTTYRLETEYVDNRRPKAVKFSSSLKDDLMRRDFTINALAMDIDDEIIDFYNGLEDLKNGIIRCVGTPQSRFEEDSLRKLRAVRFAAQKNFTIEQDTFEAIQANPSLNGVSAERIQVEFSKILLSEQASKGMELLLQSGLLKEFMPEILACVGFDQNNSHHAFDVFDHLNLCLDHVEATIEMRLSALLHDIGKPNVYTEDEEGVGHFFGHELASEAIATVILNRLKYPTKTKKQVLDLIHYHMRKPVLKGKAVRKFISKVGVDLVPDLLKLFRADMMASHPDQHEASLIYLEALSALVDKIVEERLPINKKDLVVNGRDVIDRYGEDKIKGKEIGLILDYLLNCVIEEPALNKRDSLEELMDKYVKEALSS